MLVYQPIDPGVPSDDIAEDDIVTLWEPSYFHAEFRLLSSDRENLRISFNAETIVRILDEMPLSTETDPLEWSGLVPGHFAYVVTGDKLPMGQSEAWVSLNSPTHYRFLTGWGCMDVLSRNPPSFSRVDRVTAPTA
jgi:hypothetical protein